MGTSPASPQLIGQTGFRARICWVGQGLSGVRRARRAVMDAVNSAVVSYAAVPGHSLGGRVRP